jgi:hypothetical protein
MIRLHQNTPPIIRALQDLGYAVFENKDYDLNIIGARNPDPRPDEFDDLLHVVYKSNGKWTEQIFPCTLDAGAHWHNNPMRSTGTAALIHPYQYRSAFTFGKHRGKYDCLVQTKAIPVWRDNNRNSILDEYNPSSATAIQIHQAGTASVNVGRWSAGCCVLQSGFGTFMELCRKQEKAIRSKIFSFTILEGRYL